MAVVTVAGLVASFLGGLVLLDETAQPGLKNGNVPRRHPVTIVSHGTGPARVRWVPPDRAPYERMIGQVIEDAVRIIPRDRPADRYFDG